MAAADRRAASLRPPATQQAVPEGEASLPEPPESGRDADGKQFSRDWRIHLLETFDTDPARFESDFQGLPERALYSERPEIARRGHCRTGTAGYRRRATPPGSRARDGGLTYYFIARMPENPEARAETRSVLAELKQSFPSHRFPAFGRRRTLERRMGPLRQAPRSALRRPGGQPVKFLDIADDAIVELAATGDMPEAVHQFEAGQIRAINAALAARRPLLVRGEPGIGKSQLARAAAKGLGRAFVPHTVDARTESRDLLWHFDAVARLAEAQLLGALCRVADLDPPDPALPPAEKGDKAEAPNIRDRLAIARFLHPRALWWAFDWNGALDRAKAIGISAPPQPDGGDPANGCLVLIDEIDKAEADVPNGLLEALGAGSFHPPGLHRAGQGDRYRAVGGHHHQRGARLAGRFRAPLSGVAFAPAVGPQEAGGTPDRARTRPFPTAMNPPSPTRCSSVPPSC